MYDTVLEKAESCGGTVNRKRHYAEAVIRNVL